MTNPTTIARSLSEAQRAMLKLLCNNEYVVSLSTDWQAGLDPYLYSTHGVDRQGRYLYKVTKLGREVRAAILAEQEGGA